MLHIAVFAGSVWLPGVFDHKPLLDDIVTVDLVSMPEPEPVSPAPVTPVAKPPEPVVETPPQPADPPPEPEPVEVAVAPEPVVTPEPVAKAKPISLVPRKRKLRKAKDTRLAEEKEQEKREQRAKIARQEQQKRKKEALARKRKAEQKRKRAEKQRRQRAIAAARRAQLEADRAAAMAREELASVIRQKGAAGRTAANGNASGRKVQSVVLKQYLSSLYERVHGYWILPEMRKWDRGLETIVVLTILRDGSVAGMQIERKSRDPFFDQFVMKTLQSAAPMPRFPALMSQASIEVGLRFKPGELAM